MYTGQYFGGHSSGHGVGADIELGLVAGGVAREHAQARHLLGADFAEAGGGKRDGPGGVEPAAVLEAQEQSLRRGVRLERRAPQSPAFCVR